MKAFFRFVKSRVNNIAHTTEKQKDFFLQIYLPVCILQKDQQKNPKLIVLTYLGQNL